LIRTAESATGPGAASGGDVGKQFFAPSKFFCCGCIQSLRFGVMLAEPKKWKLAKNMSAEPLVNAAKKS
jgi:hypothetical protein